MRKDEETRPDSPPVIVPITRARRKLLAATVGLAFVSMVGAGCSTGNPAPPDSGPDANDDDSGAGR